MCWVCRTKKIAIFCYIFAIPPLFRWKTWWFLICFAVTIVNLCYRFVIEDPCHFSAHSIIQYFCLLSFFPRLWSKIVLTLICSIEDIQSLPGFTPRMLRKVRLAKFRLVKAVSFPIQIYFNVFFFDTRNSIAKRWEIRENLFYLESFNQKNQIFDTRS